MTEAEEWPLRMPLSRGETTSFCAAAAADNGAVTAPNTTKKAKMTRPDKWQNALMGKRAAGG
jgi:hypothetical protein